MERVIMFSGGLDSLIGWFYMDKPQAIYCKMGHKYQEKELACINALQELIPDLDVKIVDALNLGQFEEEENAFIKNRNLHLAAIGSNFGDEIIIVGVKGDNVGDKSPDAFQSFSRTLSLINNSDILVMSPFWRDSKTNIIKWYINKGYPLEWLKTSISCYDPGLTACGKCPSCFRKWIALEDAGVECIDWFDNDLREWPGSREYLVKFSEGKYDLDRIASTLRVFLKYKLI